MTGIYILERTSDKTALTQTVASQTLTFTGNVSNGELVNISTSIFEFSTDGTAGAGHIIVNVTAGSDGTVDRTVAITNLTAILQNSTDLTALVTVANS